MSREPPLVGTLRQGKCISYVQRPSNDDGGAAALLRGRVCFVLGQVWLLRWCDHEAREETEEGQFETKAPSGWYFEARQVYFLCAAAKN